MRIRCNLFIPLFFILLGACLQPVHAQLGFDLDIKKPKPYEERELRSEKTGDKKLTAPKKFFQNLTTHYNYFFNASTKLNEVIERAKTAHKDDYTQLLPFYNFSLDATAQSQTELDSVIYKAQTGIVMHDLRNDWIDNLYLLWGASYYLQKQFDSASMMFQFINYAFADKEKDGYYKYIGSRMDGNNALSVSTPEKKGGFLKPTPPSRNSAFIWQIRTLIEEENFAESGSLIATLKNDPLFPARLALDLEEVQAYWFYKQQVWDSSATHLERALEKLKKKGEKARWEFLTAQMYERAGRFTEAEKLYARSISHTTDPVMDVYARLNLVRINTSGGENYIDKNIAELVKMARKDKYEDYRDVIYYMAAQMEMERNNLAAAQELMMKAAKANNGNLASRNHAYLLIADLSFDQKKYAQAASFYDSVQVRDLTAVEATRVTDRKAALTRIVRNQDILRRQDSLQRIAAMPEEERNAFLSRMLKQLRKQQGLDEQAPSSGNPLAGPAPDLFQQSQQQKGEWYFYNTTLKTQGAQQFKQTWGNRPNVDNWRRFADVNQQLVSKLPNKTREADKTGDPAAPTDLSPSLQSLLNGLPITEGKKRQSDDSIRMALFNLGTAYLNDVEDYASAIEALEQLRNRFPADLKMDEVLFNLYYAYYKAGDMEKANQIKKLLTEKYPSSRSAVVLTTGKDPANAPESGQAATKAYETIYDLFLEGRFEEAEAAKKLADSTYKTNRWEPQLLYIEAVYQIRQRNDSVAAKTLQTLIAQDPNAPLGKKAQNLLQVLSRRAQIEDELTRLQVQRPVEDSVTKEPVVSLPPPPPPLTMKKDSVINQPKTAVAARPVPQKPVVDTAAKKPIVQAKPPSTSYRFDPTEKHLVVIVLNKVDPVFINEARNAFNRYGKEKYADKNLNGTLVELDKDQKLLLIGDFANAQEALDYALAARRAAAGDIVPWLKADKYSFSILSTNNLPILLEKKDLAQYRQFLEQNLPGKF